MVDTHKTLFDPLGLSSNVRVNITGCPDTPALVEARPKAASPAKWAYMRLVQAIDAFEKKLDPNHVVGLNLVSFGASQVFHAEDIGYWEPDWVIFYGHGADGAPVQLIQHESQLSVLLVASRKQTAEEPTRRIGFDMIKRLEAETSDISTPKVPVP